MVRIRVQSGCGSRAAAALFPCSSGKSPHGVCAFFLNGIAATAGKPAARKNLFCEAIQGVRARSTAAAENFSFVFAEIVDDAPIPPRREGRTRGRHDMRGGDAVAVLELQRDLIAPTNNIDTDVKSCGPGIPVLMPSRSRCLRVVPTTGARQPVPEEITYKR